MTSDKNSEGSPSGRLAGMFRALNSRNYRLFFSGQSISLIGTWLTRIATSWLVFRLTGSSLLLGTVSFAGQIPTLLFAPYAGVVVDRHNRHRILVITQVLAMVQSLALAALTISGVIQIWHLLVLSVMQGIINAFDMPARQAFLVEMVRDKSDLPNAIALNSSMVNAARLIGPAVGGILISLVGEGMCFLVDGISYIAVVASLLLMRVSPRDLPRRAGRAHQHFAEGFRYAFGFAPIRALLLLIAIISLCGMPYTVLMPIVVTRYFHGDAHTLGFLMAASGVGALTSALMLASRQTVLGLGKWIRVSSALFGVGLILFSMARSMWFALPLMALVGGSMMLEMACTNTILQTIVEEDKRGRVMSFYGMAFFGSVPFGSLIAGALAEHIGPMLTIAIGGGCCIAGSLWFSLQFSALRAHIRPIYSKLGILPEMAAGIGSATELRTAEND